MICNMIYFLATRHLMPDGTKDFPYLLDEILGNTFIVRQIQIE